MSVHSSVQVSTRIKNFSYAIRNIVAEARKVEAGGKAVRYLNIGDPIAAGFSTPPHLIEAVHRAMRHGQNGYTPSTGILEAREAVADDFSARGFPVDPDRVVLTTGTSEGIELTLNALVDPDDEVLVPTPTYPLYTAVVAKMGAKSVYYRTDPDQGWQPDLDHIRSLITDRTRALVLIDPNNPTGAVYPRETKLAIIELAEQRGLTILSDEVYGDLAYSGPVEPLGSHAPDAAIVAYSSLSKAYLAPGWRGGWMAVGRTRRLDPVLAAIKKLADARLCSPGPIQHAITAALRGDRSHQQVFNAALLERAQLTADRFNAMPGMRCVMPQGAFYAMPQLTLPPGKTDEDFVLGLLREMGVLVVYGSGFGCDPAAGTFRVVFLPRLEELSRIYDDIAAYTATFLAAA
jgi:alanine-synthesizing transaminase